MCIDLVFTLMWKDTLRGPLRNITSNVDVPGISF